MTDDPFFTVQESEADDPFFDDRYAMFSLTGARAVRLALEPKLAQLREQKLKGFVATEEKVDELVHAVQAEVANLGFLEVGDTAVREELWAAFEMALR